MPEKRNCYELYKKKSGKDSKSGNKGIAGTSGHGAKAGRQNNNASETNGGNGQKLCVSG